MVFRKKIQKIVRVGYLETPQNIRICFEQCLHDSVDDFIQISFDKGVNEFIITYNEYETIIT
jgi:hypothetical protein